MEETILWQGARSQITNLGTYALALLLLAAAVVGGFLGFFMPLAWILVAAAVLWIAWIWISTKAEHFTLTTERLRIKKGVFNQTFDEVELYRVKDISLTRSALQRLLSLGTVVMQTSDRGQENIFIESVRQSEELREHLRKQVELIRDRKRVREVDFQEDPSHPHESDA
jgi:membrane protein YdbS with pleckstrin-like domain